MQRPAGGYAARRVGDFENPEAKSPPPPDALRAYARIFGGAPATDADEHDGVAALEDELLSLRNGIDAPAPEAPPAPGRRWKVLAGLGAVIVLGMLSMILIGQRDTPAPETFCVRNEGIRPSPGSVGVVCARDVRLRPSPEAPADQAVAVLASGQRFSIDRYLPTGGWVHGSARLDNGEQVEGWMQSG